MQVEHIVGGSLLHLSRVVVAEPSQRNLAQMLHQHGAHVHAEISISVMAAARGKREQNPPRYSAGNGQKHPEGKFVKRRHAFDNRNLRHARNSEVGNEPAQRGKRRYHDVLDNSPPHRLYQAHVHALRGGLVYRFHTQLSSLLGNRADKSALRSYASMLVIANFNWKAYHVQHRKSMLSETPRNRRFFNREPRSRPAYRAASTRPSPPRP